MGEHVQMLSKKHGQLKQAITKMVQTVMGFLDETPSMEMKLAVIDSLRTVTEGKVRTSFSNTNALKQALTIPEEGGWKIDFC